MDKKVPVPFAFYVFGEVFPFHSVSSLLAFLIIAENACFICRGSRVNEALLIAK